MAVLLVNDDFGVIFSSHRGKGALSAETEFVGQRHTLPVSRDDADEASTLFGGYFDGYSSPFSIPLQS
ncbi:MULTISPECIES: hypothetical protein [Porphyromonas]|uniref:hypothetical protein n=1 Tax=Porphyromonas TaxID=836 RepID=UPI00052CC7A4|nr:MULTISPECIES: hypothetical protein [Porphyromonas]KGO04835.1 hypothetical protein HR16_02910 [Porphyromonas gulae]MBB6275041.1 hypothetical protein [Porphyromonas circumdentaria]